MNILVVGSEGRMGGFHAKHAAKYGNVLRIDAVLGQHANEQRHIMDSASAAIIASPTDTHAEWAHALISRGIPVLIEKPAASTIYDAIRIKVAADFNNVPVHIGYLNRFNPAWQEFAASVDGEGRFWSNRSSHLVGREYGGVGLDLATHDIDLVFQRWPDAIITPTIRTTTTHQLEVYVPSANVSGRITARYNRRRDEVNVSEWTWVSNDGVMVYANLRNQAVSTRGDASRYNDDQVDLQLQAWLMGGRGVATIEDGIRAMAVL